MRRPRFTDVAAGVTAAVLVALSSTLPLWGMTMRAPQYPKGLRLDAHGTRMTGDLRELNILNHYIGMRPIEMPSLETALYPIGMIGLVTLCVAAPFHRRLRHLAVAALAVTPVAVLADLQWRLYTFGHTLNPHAPIRLKPFTPLVLGTSTMGNFVTSAMVSSGIVCLLAAAVVLACADRLGRRFENRARRAAPGTINRRRAIAAATTLVLAGVTLKTSAEPVPTNRDLQARLDAAAPGSTVTVDGGIHHGPIVIHGPLTVVGTNMPIVDGGGTGSVVVIDGTDVVFRGFVIRNSGREVTEEAAGITVTGDRHRMEGNDVRDVYFGIHVAGGAGHVVRDNTITPGDRHGARPGHGISVWNARDAQLVDNRISHARDGIYLSFSDGVTVSDNEVTRCRYGVHSMYSQNAVVERNRLTANLLGAALMMSDRLVLRGNRIERHREGSAAYGVLLKDIGNLRVEDNVILANRIGIYAEGVGSQPSQDALLAHNVIAGHDVGLALQSNAAMTVTENRIADNLTDVSALGRNLSSSMRWSRSGRGNSWSQYRGYDADANGIGDMPHRVDASVEALLRRNPMAQAFLYTPAHLALEAAARMFPLFRQPPLLTDDHPLTSQPAQGAR